MDRSIHETHLFFVIIDQIVFVVGHGIDYLSVLLFLCLVVNILLLQMEQGFLPSRKREEPAVNCVRPICYPRFYCPTSSNVPTQPATPRVGSYTGTGSTAGLLDPRLGDRHSAGFLSVVRAEARQWSISILEPRRATKPDGRLVRSEHCPGTRCVPILNT